MRDDRIPHPALPALREGRGEVLPLAPRVPVLHPGSPVRAALAFVVGAGAILALSSLPEILGWFR